MINDFSYATSLNNLEEIPHYKHYKKNVFLQCEFFYAFYKSVKQKKKVKINFRLKNETKLT